MLRKTLMANSANGPSEIVDCSSTETSGTAVDGGGEPDDMRGLRRTGQLAVPPRRREKRGVELRKAVMMNRLLLLGDTPREDLSVVVGAESQVLKHQFINY